MKRICKVILKRGETFLVLKRATHSKNFPGLWDLPGGKRDPGETVKQAAERELREETGIVSALGDELPPIEYRDERRHRWFHYFPATSDNGTVALSDEHTAFRWLTPDEICRLDMHPSLAAYFCQGNL